jgi:glycosyltransferase involved in cell wall biosynthesis
MIPTAHAQMFHSSVADAQHLVGPVSSRTLAAAMARVLQNGGVAPTRLRHPPATAFFALQLLSAAAPILFQPPTSKLDPMEDPLVTVVVVSHNRGKLLHDAVGSVVNQTYPNIQLVVVDDGSTDAEALAFLADIDNTRPRPGLTIEVLRTGGGAYLGKARNLGWKAARGEFVTFLDDDDMLIRDGVDKYMRAMQYSGVDVITSQTALTRSRFPSPSSPYNVLYLYVGPALAAGLQRNVFGSYNIMVKRSALAACGGYTELVGLGLEDWELNARLALRNFTMVIYPGWTIHYRKLSKSNMMATMDAVKSHRRVLDAYIQELRLPEALHPLILRSLMKSL